LNIRSALGETEVNDVKYEEQYTRLGNCIKFKVVEGEVTLNYGTLLFYSVISNYLSLYSLGLIKKTCTVMENEN